nr:hypothetical protein Itr_chr01CG12870 [Ipomoea trifida]
MECVREKESKPRILTGFDRRQSSLVAPPLRCFNPRLRWPVVMKDLFVFLDDEMDINYGVVV